MLLHSRLPGATREEKRRWKFLIPWFLPSATAGFHRTNPIGQDNTWKHEWIQWMICFYCYYLANQFEGWGHPIKRGFWASFWASLLLQYTEGIKICDIYFPPQAYCSIAKKGSPMHPSGDFYGGPLADSSVAY